MKFTFKKEQNKCFNFLDVKVNRENNVFTTSGYCKPSFSGICTYFDSYMPLNYKFSLISTIIFCSFTIRSDMPKFHHNACKIKGIFIKNGTVKDLLTNVLKHSSIKYLFLNE